MVDSTETNILREAVRNSIRQGSILTSDYLAMNGLSTIVASYGLLSNSAAVVIGAMIIAMLLGPITGLALAMTDGDNSLLRRALVAEAGGGLLLSFPSRCSSAPSTKTFR